MNPELMRVLGSTWECSGEGMTDQDEAQGGFEVLLLVGQSVSHARAGWFF